MGGPGFKALSEGSIPRGTLQQARHAAGPGYPGKYETRSHEQGQRQKPRPSERQQNPEHDKPACCYLHWAREFDRPPAIDKRGQASTAPRLKATLDAER